VRAGRTPQRKSDSSHADNCMTHVCGEYIFLLIRYPALMCCIIEGSLILFGRNKSSSKKYRCRRPRQQIIDLLVGLSAGPLGTCYWIGDDGTWNKTKRCVVLCTDCPPALKDPFIKGTNLKCTINKHYDGFRIRISSESTPELQTFPGKETLLAPHMPSMMQSAVYFF
jgi:hypothetical protein